MLKYYRVFANQIKPLACEPQFSDFYDPSVGQKSGEILFVLFVTLGTGLKKYALYKYFKQMTDEKLKVVYYQPDHLWTDFKTIRELHKVTSVQIMVHIPPPKEIKYSHYEVIKPNEEHWFDLLYVSYNVFEGNTCKYLLADVEVECY